MLKQGLAKIPEVSFLTKAQSKTIKYINAKKKMRLDSRIPPQLHCASFTRQLQV